MSALECCDKFKCMKTIGSLSQLVLIAEVTWRQIGND